MLPLHGAVQRNVFNECKGTPEPALGIANRLSPSPPLDQGAILSGQVPFILRSILQAGVQLQSWAVLPRGSAKDLFGLPSKYLFGAAIPDRDLSLFVKNHTSEWT